MSLRSPVKKVSNISHAYQKKLGRLGIKTIGGLLFHFPHRYEDWSETVFISELKLGQTACVKGKVKKIEGYRTARKKINITKAFIKDKTGVTQALWFNQPYLKETLKTEREICFCGKFELGKEGPFLSNPVYEKLNKGPQIHTGRLVPVYPETEGVSSRWLRYILHPLVQKYTPKMPETLPGSIIEEEGLMGMKQALKQIHWPDSLVKASEARHRFSFEELFLLELKVLAEKKRVEHKKAFRVPIDKKITEKFINSLPFNLTQAQQRSTEQILQDMREERPMSRLLQGDVGAGKTIVAAIAALNAVEQGYQTALMAPTEILAHQHFSGFSDIFKEFDIPISLLTSTFSLTRKKGERIERSKEKIIKKIRDGNPGIFVGTHALIQKKVNFKKLALAIIDEQHRFGVKQRAELRNKEPVPHLLSVTATPIPRSLALTAYGDLELSIIDELPAGRKEIKTEVVSPEQRDEVYKLVKKEIQKGRQAFVICPRISSSDKESDWQEVKNAEQEYKKLSGKVFPDLEIGMLHGQLEPKQKERIMNRFKKAEIDVLVSTSVVEVGVDIPNATVMIIEGAERFGLAQLHQFRGRIGRSEHQAYCFLFTTSPQDTEKRRLQAMVKTNDGFELAQKDLEIRGPGDFLGGRQSGVPDLAMASLHNTKLVEKTRSWAQKILEKSPELQKYPNLKKRLKRFKQEVHLE